MAKPTFKAVGENIHCTRIYKVSGSLVKEQGDGSFAIVYKDQEEQRLAITWRSVTVLVSRSISKRTGRVGLTRTKSSGTS